MTICLLSRLMRPSMKLGIRTRRVSPSLILHCRRGYQIRHPDSMSAREGDGSGISVRETPLTDTIMEIDMPQVGVDTLAEPTLNSLGLCNATPVGVIQRCIEYLHVSLDLPWWGAIATCAVAVRLCLFPIYVRQQKALVKFINSMSDANQLSIELEKAQKEKDMEKLLRLGTQRDQLMKDLPTRDAFFITPIVQGGVLSSMFLGLHRMAALPVESLKTGGLGWFTDLTATDPYLVLPLVCSSVFLITLEAGGDSERKVPPMVKNGLRLMAPVLFVLSLRFEAAVVFYFCVNNTFTLTQAQLFRRTRLKRLCGIGETKPPPAAPPKANFRDGLKESMITTEIIHEMKERQRLQKMAEDQKRSKAK